MFVLFQLTKVAFNLHHFLVGMTHQLFQLYHLHINTNSEDDFHTVSQLLGGNSLKGFSFWLTSRRVKTQTFILCISHRSNNAINIVKYCQGVCFVKTQYNILSSCH